MHGFDDVYFSLVIQLTESVTCRPQHQATRALADPRGCATTPFFNVTGLSGHFGKNKKVGSSYMGNPGPAAVWSQVKCQVRNDCAILSMFTGY